jgi:hypothetical protein
MHRSFLENRPSAAKLVVTGRLQQGCLNTEGAVTQMFPSIDALSGFLISTLKRLFVSVLSLLALMTAMPMATPVPIASRRRLHRHRS